MEEFENTLKISIIKKEKELIKNPELKNFLQFKLNKKNIMLEDLDNINEIILDSKNIIGQYNPVYFEEIDLFKNLEKISIRNLGLISANIGKMNNIKAVEFINSQVKDITILNNTSSLILNNTEVDNFEQIVKLQNLEELQLINMKINDFKFLQDLKNIKKLVVKNIKDFSLNKIDFDLQIEYLSVENLEDLKLDILSKFKNLKIISVDRIEADNWGNELKALKNRNIQILLNDIYKY